MAQAVLITGATGKQGGAVIRALLASNSSFEILAVTRNAQSSAAQSLLSSSPKVKLIEGNLDDSRDIFTKAKELSNTPIKSVFSVQASIPSRPASMGSSTEEQQGKSLIDAALENGIQHFVYSSVDRGGPKSDTSPTNIPHFIKKHQIEQYLFKRSENKMNWTVLRPVAFFENLVPGFFGKVFTTSFERSLKKDEKLQFVATSDIGFFAAQAMMNPKDYTGVKLSLAGDELSFDQFKRVFEQNTGQGLPKTFSLVTMALNWAIKDLGVMFNWFRDHGYDADISALKKKNPDMKDFACWLEQESEFKELVTNKASRSDN